MVEHRTRLSNSEDVEDFINGLAFYATGGGGPMVDGMELLGQELANDEAIGWVDIDDLPEETWTATVTRIGGPAPAEGGPGPEELELYGLRDDVHGNEGGQPRVNRQVVAVPALERYAGVNIGGIIPVELGAGNLPGAMVTASRLGIPFIDGDYVGRAAPEIGNMKVELAGASVAPFSLVDRWNNTTIVTEVTGAAMADRMGRMLGVASFGRLGMAAYLMPAREARAAMVRNSVSLSLELGRVIRRGRSDGRPIEEILAHTHGWLLFKGRVIKTERDPKAAFQHFYGTHSLLGTEEFEGKSLRIWFKNEHHIAWLDDTPIVTSPDLISTVNRQTGVPVINVDIREGQELAVLGLKPLDPIYRTAEGISAFGPRHFGFDIDYVPIEESLGSTVNAGTQDLAGAANG